MNVDFFFFLILLISGGKETLGIIYGKFSGNTEGGVGMGFLFFSSDALAGKDM